MSCFTDAQAKLEAQLKSIAFIAAYEWTVNTHHDSYEYSMFREAADGSIEDAPAAIYEDALHDVPGAVLCGNDETGRWIDLSPLSFTED